MEDISREDSIKFISMYKAFAGKPCKDLNCKAVDSLSKVARIDQKIIDLIDTRNYILYGLNSKCLAVNPSRLCIGCDPIKLWNAYKEDRFNSKLVKDAVASVRALFLNDADEKFRRFYCVQIVHPEYGYSSDDINFIFEDDAGNSLRITMNIKRYEDEHLYTYKCLNGYIYACVKSGFDYTTIERSFDPDVIRSAIEKWIDSGFKLVPYAFDHDTLQDKIADKFTEFKELRIRDAYFNCDED